MKPSPLGFLFTVAMLAGIAAAKAAEAGPPDVSPAQPVIPGRSFNLRDFGAVGDGGATVNTGAFQRSVDAVSQAGGGTLIVPEGTYFTGPFDLCSNLNLRLEKGATLLFSPRFDDYRSNGPKKYRPQIQISNAHDVLISGAGTINGNGAAWWPEALRFKAEADARHASSNTSPRPVMVAFSHCQRIRVEGITFTNAPVYSLAQSTCQDVTVDGITVLNPADAPNTDGIDPKNCQRVLIAHCRIDTGDDCIALGGNSGATEKDILVTDCTFLHGHGCSIGSGTAGGLCNMIVRRCTFDGTDTGVRFKSARDRGGLVEDVVYEDLTMRNVGVAVSISSYYENSAVDSAQGPGKAEPVTTTTPHWRNLTIRNVTAIACRSRAGLIAGLPEMPAEAITLDNVTIDAPKGLRVANVRGITLHNVRITAAKGPDVISDDSVQGLVRSK
jgi:polygalacturonase